MKDVKKVNINLVDDGPMPALGELNERTKSIVEAWELSMVPALDGFPVEYVKNCGATVLEWLGRLLNGSFDMGAVPVDWRGA